MNRQRRQLINGFMGIFGVSFFAFLSKSEQNIFTKLFALEEKELSVLYSFQVPDDINDLTLYDRYISQYVNLNKCRQIIQDFESAGLMKVSYQKIESGMVEKNIIFNSKLDFLSYRRKMSFTVLPGYAGFMKEKLRVQIING